VVGLLFVATEEPKPPFGNIVGIFSSMVGLFFLLNSRKASDEVLAMDSEIILIILPLLDELITPLVSRLEKTTLGLIELFGDGVSPFISTLYLD